MRLLNRTCAKCGKRFYRVPSRHKDINFCSKSCKSYFQRSNGQLRSFFKKSKIKNIDERNKMVELLERGKTIQELMEYFNCSRPTIMTRIKEAGIPFNNKSWRRNPAKEGYGHSWQENTSDITLILLLNGLGIGDYVIANVIQKQPCTVKSRIRLLKKMTTLKSYNCMRCHSYFYHPIERNICFKCSAPNFKVRYLTEIVEYFSRLKSGATLTPSLHSGN